MTQVLGSGKVQREQLLPGGIGSVGSRRGHPGLLQGCIQVLLARGRDGYCELSLSVMLLRKVVPSCVASLPR